MSWKIKFHILLTGLTLTLLMYLDQRGEALEPKVRVAQRENKAKIQGPAKQAKPKQPQFLGVQSCSAVACHGGDGPSNQLNYEPGSEYSTWVQTDPHSQAFTVLKNGVSIKMAKALRLEKPAHEAPLCLNCHGPQQASPINDANLVNHELIEGVSCEACHGNAEKWLFVHRRRNWKAGKTPQQIWDEYGFRDTKDTWTRAKVCASCHVGAPGGKDVNHDLYAAGHPRLFFELAAFNANLPAHWDRNEDRKRESDDEGKTSTFEAKLWAVGQLAGVHSAVELAQYRAQQSLTSFSVTENYPAGATIPAWPEFAETGCFACHHQLKAPSWRQVRGFANRKPGDFPWQSWLTPLASGAASISGQDGVAELQSSLAEFSRLMSGSRPNVQQIVIQGDVLKAKLINLGRRLSDQNNQISADQIKASLSRLLTTDGNGLVKENWDSATQLYLAVVPLSEALRDVNGRAGQEPSAATKTALEAIRHSLEFSDNYDSPKGYSTFDTDKKFDTDISQLILDQLKAIAGQIDN
jgi:hypothetical protein